MTSRVEGVAAAEKEAAYADGTGASTSDGYAMGGQGIVDVTPVTTGANRSNFGLAVIGGGVEES